MVFLWLYRLKLSVIQKGQRYKQIQAICRQEQIRIKGVEEDNSNARCIVRVQTEPTHEGFQYWIVNSSRPKSDF